MVDLTFIPIAAMYYAEPAEYQDGTYTNNPTAPRWCTYSSPMKSRYYGVHHGDIGPHQYLHRRWVAVPMTLSDRSETRNNTSRPTTAPRRSQRRHVDLRRMHMRTAG